MDARHKKKAFIGMAAWLVAPFVVALLFGLILYAALGSGAADSNHNKSAAGTVMVISFLLVEYVCFFWSCSHLAKAKGYSNALVIPGIFGPLAQVIVYIILLFALPDKCPSSSSPMRRKSSRRHESQIARVVRYRRNALVITTLGFVGILAALFLVFVPIGLFDTRANAEVAAILVFVPSYCAVINGCWWWVRAKNWHEAVVFIGLMPLALLTIRYVRLIYLMVPMLLPTTMVFMPVIMLGVIAVLPDKSGIPKRKRWDRD